jgi:hypothetical protein
MNIQRIKELQERSRQLTAELEQALKIKALWPEAFDLGSVTVSPILRLGDKKAGMRYIVRRSDGQERTFTQEQWG